MHLKHAFVALANLRYINVFNNDNNNNINIIIIVLRSAKHVEL